MDPKERERDRLIFNSPTTGKKPKPTTTDGFTRPRPTTPPDAQESTVPPAAPSDAPPTSAADSAATQANPAAPRADGVDGMAGPDPTQALAKKFRYILIASLVMDVLLFIASLLVIPSYLALTADEYLDNGNLSLTEEFIVARQGSNFTNTPREDSEVGIYISGCNAAVCLIVAGIDIWCLVAVKSVLEEKQTDRELHSVLAWILGTCFLVVTGVAQFLILLVVLGRGRAHAKKSKTDEHEPIFFMFPPGIDYSTDREKWDSTVELFVDLFYVTLTIGFLHAILRPLLIFLVAHFKKDARKLDEPELLRKRLHSPREENPHFIALSASSTPTPNKV